MKEKMSQLFKDKVFLVLLVLGLLTIVAAAGVIPFKEETMTARVPILKFRTRRVSLQKRRYHRKTR